MVTEALGQVKQIKAQLNASGNYYAMLNTHIYQFCRETHVTAGFNSLLQSLECKNRSCKPRQSVSVLCERLIGKARHLQHSIDTY